MPFAIEHTLEWRGTCESYPHGESRTHMADLTGLDKKAQFDVLRRRMAVILGRRDHAPIDLPDTAAPAVLPSSPPFGNDPRLHWDIRCLFRHP